MNEGTFIQENPLNLDKNNQRLCHLSHDLPIPPEQRDGSSTPKRDPPPPGYQSSAIVSSWDKRTPTLLILPYSPVVEANF